MNPLGRRTRRSDEWASPHERARTRAAQRLDWELDRDEAVWLEAHLVECDRCRTVADEYLEIRDGLQALRSSAPEPPRDLWARTAAAIEREAARSGSRRFLRAGRIPFGALSGALVVGVVLGATLLSNAPLRVPVTPTDEDPQIALGSDGLRTLAPISTPILVGAGNVQYVRRDRDGRYGLNVTRVDEVCPEDGKAGCPMVEDTHSTALTFEAEPESIIGSPDDNHAIVVGSDDGSTAANVYVMPLPTDPDASTPEPTANVESPAPGTEPPVDTPLPSDPATSAEPVATADATGDTTAPEESPDASPLATDAPPSAEPRETPSADPTASPGPVAIARDLIVDGVTAAYSPDGTWFAFTARPSDGSHGTDIYLWRVGDDLAKPITSDHRSVFGSWLDGQLVGSRSATALAGGTEGEAKSFLLDPETGEETALVDAGWRPIVAPSGRFAVAWSGTVAGSNEGRQVGPAAGRLELRLWDGQQGPVRPADATLIAPEGFASFDARFDESGTAFAVWLRDPANPELGRLSLYFVDPDTGRIRQPKNAPRDVPALAGFSIGDSRLAWATPSGQGGEGSRVLIVAWTDDGVGRIESAPGDEVVVIR